MGRLLLALDLSTTATGYAIFDIETKHLLKYGHIKVKSTGLRGTQYPLQQLIRMQDMAAQIKTSYIDAFPELEMIVIEEINRGISRLGQKTLDGLHWILLDRIESKMKLIKYKDSDGATGWRNDLGLFLTDQDKQRNKEVRDLNKKMGRGHKKIPVITKKHLACRFVNKAYGLNLDCDLRPTDADTADAIGLGHSILFGKSKVRLKI